MCEDTKQRLQPSQDTPIVASDLLARLLENWKAWGSPTDRDKCVNETNMAMDCKEAADEIERLLALLRPQSSPTTPTE